MKQAVTSAVTPTDAPFAVVAVVAEAPVAPDAHAGQDDAGQASVPLSPASAAQRTPLTSRAQQELDLIAACKEKSAAALEVMASLMVTGENERTRMTAAQFILERAYGKAVQQVDGDLDVALQISRIERVILKP